MGDGDRLFADPDAVLDERDSRILTKMRQEYAAAENHKAFWNEFYSKHGDLRPARRVVEGVFNEHLGRLADTPASKAMDEIAKLSRREIGRIVGRPEPERPSPAPGRRDEREAFVGDGSELAHGAAWSETPASTEKSLGSIIRARKNARRKAMGLTTYDE